ncbi:hypothetical protein [Diaphorobacter sp.]|uniref:hypothetical protein n=1 Tax=Diaphorobacter sp. TaxID=1934310 RepID=UPI0025844E37|nr:hypothetical protein [Diaphorobacter sp.]
MPEMTAPRPVLRSFRVLASNGENRGEAAGVRMRLELQQEIEFGLAVPDVAGAPLMVGVRVKLGAKATNENDAGDVATYAGEYEARFYYPAGVTEDTVTPLLDNPEYQYVLVAQAFPLAMSHFRRELQAMGLDARELPLGLPYN